MNFISPATQITAAHWNDIFQAADSALTSALGGLSAILALQDQSITGLSVDKQWDRAFFFFDPLNVSAPALHPLAQPFATNHLFGLGLKQYYQQAMYFRQYNHGAITGVVSGLSTSGSPVHGVQKLSKPAWAAWSAAVYPNGFSTLITSGMFSGTVPADNILDVSLGVIRVGGNAVTFNDLTTAEHEQPLKPIDVFINADLAWDNTNWDKYSIIRVHNCGRAPHTIFSTSIAPGASRCFRRSGGGWLAQGNYFHWMESGDGRFLQMRESGLLGGTGIEDPTGGSAAIFMPGIVANVLWNALINGVSNFGPYYDPAKFWDMSPVYNNSAYSPTGTEKTPPSGGWLPALSNSALIGDLIVPRGQFIIANHFLSTFATVNFTGFAALASALAASGTTIATRSLSQTETIVNYPATNTLNNLEIYDASGRLELVDTACPLVTFLTAGNPAASVGAMGTSGSIKLPWLLFSAITLTPNPATATYNFYSWALDGSGNPEQTTYNTVTVNLAGATSGSVYKPFLPVDSVATVAAWMQSACGVQIENVHVLSTPFGPVLLWDEIWPLDARFTTIPTDFGIYVALVKTVRVICDQSQGPALRVTRAYFLNECRYIPSSLPAASGVWPPAVPYSTTLTPEQQPSQSLLWNYARTDQAYIYTRYFYHDPSLAPMMPDWTAHSQGGTSHYATFKYLPGTSGLDDLGTNEFNVVVSFYETNPLGVDAVTPPVIIKKAGISRMGIFNSGCDIWGPFSNWLNAAGNLTYPLAPDFRSGAGSISINSAWYGSNHSSVLSNLVESNPVYTDPVPIAPNALPCQCEHFNLLAGLVAAQPSTKINYSGAGGTSFTLNFAAANMVVLRPGTGYTAGQSLGFNLKVGSIDANGGITAIAQDGAVVINTYDAYSTPQRPFTAAQQFGGPVIAAFFDTTVGDGSGLSFVPTYNPMGVPLPPGTPLTAGPTAIPYMVSPVAYGASKFFPRNAYFSWNGAGSGCADPVGDYIATLASGVTLQTTLPDSYGASILNKYGGWLNGAYYTRDGTTTSFIWGSASPGEWCEGFTPEFAILAGTYRWITIDTARTIYAAWSLPFSLNRTYAPMSFQNVIGGFDEIAVPVPDATSLMNGPTNGGYSDYAAWVAANVPDTTYSRSGPTVLYSFETQIRAADFINDPNGNWLCDVGGNISNAPMINRGAEPVYSWNKQFRKNPAYLGIFDPGIPGLGGYPQWTYQVETDSYLERLSFGSLDPVWLGTVNAPLSAMVYLVEGVVDQAIAAIPQNYAYLDPAFVQARDLSGLSDVVPYIVDNSVESGAAEVTALAGAGGTGAYDHTITTGLANARLAQIAIDGQIAAPIPDGNL